MYVKKKQESKLVNWTSEYFEDKLLGNKNEIAFHTGETFSHFKYSKMELEAFHWMLKWNFNE